MMKNLKRCNLEETLDGGVRVCFGDHDRNGHCEWVYFVRKNHPFKTIKKFLKDISDFIYSTNTINNYDSQCVKKCISSANDILDTAIQELEINPEITVRSELNKTEVFDIGLNIINSIILMKNKPLL